MIALAVLVSGSGTNLQAILDAIERGALEAKVTVVVSNVATANALARARNAGIEAVAIDHRAYQGREAFDAELVKLLRAHGADYVVLAGFMRLLTNVFLEAFPLRVINVHPALLPSFPGVDGPGQALRHGVRVSGCTVHFVDAGTDTGPILAQSAVPVLEGDDVEALRRRIQETEHRLLPEVLQWLAEGRVAIEACGRGERPRIRVSPERPGPGARQGA